MKLTYNDIEAIALEIYKEILSNMLSRYPLHVSFPGLTLDDNKLAEGVCYQALEKIKAIIADESLEDNECFMKIKEIARVLECSGIDPGIRHDFG